MDRHTSHPQHHHLWIWHRAPPCHRKSPFPRPRPGRDRSHDRLRKVPRVEGLGLAEQAHDHWVRLVGAHGDESRLPVHAAGSPPAEADPQPRVLAVRYASFSPSSVGRNTSSDPPPPFPTPPPRRLPLTPQLYSPTLCAVTVAAVGCIGLAEALDPSMKRKKEQDF